MRIALCNALYPTPAKPNIVGGAEILVRQLAQGLVGVGHKVIAIRAALDGRAHVETVNDVEVHFLPIRNIYPPFDEKRNPILRMVWHAIDDRWLPPDSVRQILTEFQPDVLNTHTLNGLSTGIWQVAHELRIPIVHTLHDYYLICPRCARFRDGRSCINTCGSCSILSRGRRERAGLIDAVTSVSQRTLDIHRQNGVFDDGTPSYIIPNVPNSAIALVKVLSFDAPLIIGYIGRFAEEKGVRLLVEAASRLPAGSVELVLAGHVGEEERNRLTALAGNVRVTFLGFADPLDFYRQIHVTAFPSIWEEPAALVVQDSLAAARPPIVTVMGGAPESVEHGVNGWLVEPSAEAFERQFRELLARPDLLAAAQATLVHAKEKRRVFTDLVADYQAVYEKTVCLAAGIAAGATVDA